MSLINSIVNCRKSLGNGSSRQVFYSKKYNLIIKRMIRRNHDFAIEQQDNECQLYDVMTDDEKQIFPMRGYVTYKGEKIILMEKCAVIAYDYKLRNKYWDGVVDLYTLKGLNRISKRMGLDNSLNKVFLNFIINYNINDLFPANMGVFNNRLVIIDAGYR